jgi:hypothetical protein
MSEALVVSSTDVVSDVVKSGVDIVELPKTAIPASSLVMIEDCKFPSNKQQFNLCLATYKNKVGHRFTRIFININFLQLFCNIFLGWCQLFCFCFSIIKFSQAS